MLVIDHHLLGELCAEIIEAEVRVLGCTERKIICDVTSECPGILKDMFVICTHKGLSCREHSDIVDKRCRVSYSTASVSSHHDIFCRRILERNSRREPADNLVAGLLVEVFPETYYR